MADFESEPAQQMSAFLPLALLGVSFALLLVFQVSVLLPQRTFLQQVLTQNEQGVQQSKQVQASLQRLVMDVVTAASDDKDAQSIIAKYGIQVSGPSPIPAAPAASPAK
ncbi:MAG: hypothetical protein WCH57_01020 [Verrucomicrobiota bacterium]